MKYKIILFVVLLLIVLTAGCREKDNYDDALVEADFVPNTIRRITHVYKTIQIDVPENSGSDFILRDNLIYLFSNGVLISWDLEGNIAEEKTIAGKVDYIAVCSNGEYVIINGTQLIKESGFSIELNRKVNGLFVDRNDNIYVYTNTGIYVYWSDGDLMYNVSTYGTINKLYEAFDGRIIVDAGMYYYLDTSKRIISYGFVLPEGEIIFGGGYDYYIKDDTSLYGYVQSEGGSMKIVDFINSDVNPFKITEINILAFDKIILTLSDGKVNLLLRSPEGYLNKTILEAAVFGIDEYLASKVIEFNVTNPLVRIVLTDYLKYENGINVLNNEINDGLIPDIFVSNEILNIEKYIVDGLCVDMSELINRYDFIPSILNAINDEGIYQLPVEFSMEVLIGKTKNVGESVSWSIYTPMKDVRLFGNISDATMRRLLILSNYLSFVGTPLKFNDSYFTELMEFCLKIGVENKHYGYGSHSQYLNDKILFYYIILNNYSDFTAAKDFFGGEEITVKGLPNQFHDGIIINIKKGYSISKTCPDIDGAWDFISTLYDNNYEYKYWPATRIGLQKMINDAYIIDFFENLNTKKYYHASFISDIIDSEAIDGNSISRLANAVQWKASLYFAKYKKFMDVADNNNEYYSSSASPGNRKR